MKRILGAICMCGMISMFFTGCNSLLMPLEGDGESLERSVAAMQTSGEGNVKLDYGEDSLNQEFPDYFEQNQENKFRDLEGRPAFKLKEGHSGDTTDIEDFQIGDLLADGTFIYAYTTREEGAAMPRRIVHCVAAYNYRSGSFRVIHEKAFRRSWEAQNEMGGEGSQVDGESFYIQTNSSAQGEAQDIFVYDNGVGYLYNGSGRLMFQTDIETFVRSCFSKAYSVNTMNAINDGNNRIYLELTVEKERISLPENPQADTQPTSGGEEQDEARQAEQEMGEKMENLILVYDFTSVSTTMNQHNENFEKQQKAWAQMTEGKEFTEDEEPDARQDWDKAVKQNPDKWGSAFLPGLSDNRVYTWKDGPKFQYRDDGYICTFRSEKDSYKSYTDMRENTRLSNLFVPAGNHYNELFGKTGKISLYNEVSMTRNYTYVWFTERTGEKGETIREKHSETRTQTIRRNKSRRAPLETPYLEGYWLLDQQKITGLSTCIDGQILCTDERSLYWLQEDGSLKDTGFDLEEGYEPGAFRDGSAIYLMGSGATGMRIATDPSRRAGESGGGTRPAVDITVDYANLGAKYRHQDSVYDNAFMDLNDKLLDPSVDVYSNADFYREEDVLKGDLTETPELAAELEAWGVDTISFDQGFSRGYLFTSSNKGLIYYDPGEERSVILSEGSWYRSWKQGNRYISVGFAGGDVSYGGADMAYARVYEYSLDQLYSSAMEKTLETLREEARREEEERASQSLEGQTEETGETVKDMLKEWEESHKDKSTQVNLGTAVSQGETFDAELFESTQAEKESLEEASREQRMNEILYGSSAGSSQ